MCGICGVYGRADRRLVRQMMDVLVHRGPDGQGSYQGENVSLGVNRLSINDDETGSQPIFNEEGNICLVFNGEIYNHQQLRKRLEEQGHDFKTETDTEVIVHLYEEEGKDCVLELNGMFAFALWNGEELFLTRDRFGIKPLYYTATADEFIFASEAKSLLTHPAVEPHLNWDSLREIGIFGHLIGNSTIFEGIKQLQPGSYLQIKGNNVDFGHYANKRLPSPSQSATNPETKLKSLFTACVKRRLMGDHSPGVFLSGGIDSSILAYTAEKVTDNKIKTFSIADDTENNDFASAHQVANCLGTDHQEFVLEPDEVLSEIPRFIYHIELPDYKFIFWYLVTQRASKNMKVGLAGEGADEQFLGYPMYEKPRAKLEEWKQRVDRVGACPNSPAVFANLEQDSSRSELQAGLIRYGMRSQLQNFQLLPVDHSTMASSMEIRVPYLAPQLVDYSLSLPPDSKLQNLRKKVLRDAFSDTKIPKEVIKRPKQFGGKTTFSRSFSRLDKLADYYSSELEVGREIEKIFRGRQDYLLSFRILQELYFDQPPAIISSLDSTIDRID